MENYEKPKNDEKVKNDEKAKRHGKSVMGITMTDKRFKLLLLFAIITTIPLCIMDGFSLRNTAALVIEIGYFAWLMTGHSMFDSK